MTTLLAFLFTIAVLVVIHELGHYWVARLAGVKVLRFSVGFGRIIARRTDAHGTEWALSAIPLGGYVKMLDEREAEVPAAERDRAFNRQSLRARAAIVAAGPAANFLLAIALFWALFSLGVPATKPILGAPGADTIAYQAGLRADMTITHVDGEAVQSWQDLHWLVLKGVLRNRPVLLESRDAQGRTAQHRVQAALSQEQLERSPLAALGLHQALPPLPPVIGAMQDGSPAQRAGLLAGDRIERVDGRPVATWQALVDEIRMAPGERLTLQVARQGATLDLTLVPDSVSEGGHSIGRIGVSPHLDEAALAPYRTIAVYGPIEALHKALHRTWELSVFSLEMLGRMVVGQASLENISGPITIADYAGQSATIGAASFIAFLALISVSLGVLNLLPVPLLDGGHLMYYLVEFVTGRPVSDKAQEIGQRIGLALLGLLMFLALYNDLQRLLT